MGSALRHGGLTILFLVAIVALVRPASGALLTDDFNTAASAANYTQVQTSSDVAVTFGFDYSTLGIPVAPNTTDGSTKGVKFEANIVTPGAVEAVTLHTNQAFTGTYYVQFDAWMNTVGPFPNGGTGSTEVLTAGVGGNGTSVNRTAATITGSGGWVSMSGEGGLGRDYQMFKNASEQFAESGQFAAGTVSNDAHNAANLYYAQFGAINVANLPVQGANNGGPASQTGTTQTGSFGFEWHVVTLKVNPTGGTGGATSVAWYIDGLRIGTLNAGIGSAFSTDGRVTLGYSDPTTSVSANPTVTFGLIDNLFVGVPEPGAFLFGLVATLGIGLGTVFSRRR